MIKSTTRLRAWGNSIGVVLPKDEIKNEGLNVNDEIEITIKKKTVTLKEVFGKLKEFKAKSNKTTDELLKEVDEELDSKFN